MLRPRPFPPVHISGFSAWRRPDGGPKHSPDHHRVGGETDLSQGFWRFLRTFARTYRQQRVIASFPRLAVLRCNAPRALAPYEVRVLAPGHAQRFFVWRFTCRLDDARSLSTTPPFLSTELTHNACLRSPPIPIHRVDGRTTLVVNNIPVPLSPFGLASPSRNGETLTNPSTTTTCCPTRPTTTCGVSPTRRCSSRGGSTTQG